MSKLIDTLSLKDENGEVASISRQDYQKMILKELAVKPLKNEETESETSAELIVEHVTKNVMKGLDVDPAISDNYPELIARITEDVANHRKATESSKEDAEAKKKAKEEAKAKEAEESKAKAEALAVRQEGILKEIKVGADTAEAEFAIQVNNLRAALPEGVTIINEGAGYGLDFAESVSDIDRGRAFGYMLQASINNESFGNQIQYFVGDTIVNYVKLGIYATAKEAGEMVNKLMPPNKQYAPSMLDQYKKMAERTPVSLRNPHVDPSAYLAVANMKMPKKGDKETDVDFKLRLDKFKEARTELQKQLSSGAVTKRKDILEPVNKVLVDHGLKEKPSDEPTVNIGAMAKQFYFATVGLEHLLDVHEKDTAIYLDGETKRKLTREQLEEMRDTALAALNNVYYNDKKSGVTLKDYAKGYKIKTVKAVDKDGNKTEEELKMTIFPEVFWATPAEEKKEETTTEASTEKKPAKAGK